MWVGNVIESHRGLVVKKSPQSWEVNRGVNPVEGLVLHCSSFSFGENIGSQYCLITNRGKYCAEYGPNVCIGADSCCLMIESHRGLVVKKSPQSWEVNRGVNPVAGPCTMLHCNSFSFGENTDSQYCVFDN